MIALPAPHAPATPDQLKRLARLLGGVPIWGVLPGSAAHRAGMRYGDIVVSVNGVKTPSFIEFLEAQESNAERLEFEVLREGSVLRLAIHVERTAPS